MDRLELVKELAGSTCRCGKRKEKGQTFCKSCYYSLPQSHRSALYRPLGNGYQEAYEAAVRTLESHKESV